MKIEKIMTVEVKICTENDNLNRAAQLMRENDCGCIPVIAADGEAKLIGLLTDRDICMGSYTQGKPLSEIPVTTAMARKIISCRPSDDIRQAEALMKQNRVRRLPVTDEKEVLVGIVSINDLALEAEREATAKVKAPELPESEVAETLATICEHRGREVLAGSVSSARRRPRIVFG
jgi:CBS domain-containing protein